MNSVTNIGGSGNDLKNCTCVAMRIVTNFKSLPGMERKAKKATIAVHFESFHAPSHKTASQQQACFQGMLCTLIVFIVG